MRLFSERNGFRKVSSLLILDSVTEGLRSGIWNALDLYYLGTGPNPYIDFKYDDQDRVIFVKRLWHHHFRLTLDNLPERWFEIREAIRKYFFKCEWTEVYDFVEFVMQSHPGFGKNEKVRSSFVEFCNDVLERESIGYRIVESCFVKIVSEEEVSEVERSLKSPFENMAQHIRTAVRHLSDKKSPDFRNSVKESISAVEATCNQLLGGNDKSLGSALNELEKKGKISFHGAEKKAFLALYGYTSDAKGIRHSLVDGEEELDYDDAKFMLVSCAAFCNYLISKTKG